MKIRLSTVLPGALLCSGSFSVASESSQWPVDRIFHGRPGDVSRQIEVFAGDPVGRWQLVDGGPKVRFGTDAMGNPSVGLRVMVKNSGTRTLDHITIDFTGRDKRDFTVSYPKAKRLAPGERMVIQVYFEPLPGGKKKATMHIRRHARDQNPFDVRLVGALPPPPPPES